jgi:catechol 2,3-dioxygenase-like lactoylglutathione lyase family enzyme
MAETQIAGSVRGINHLALVCRDMARTVEFYEGVLGFPLVKTIELPAGMGQHFFFDIGGGATLAFFWFPNAPDGVPGVSHPGKGAGDISAVSSMNHVAFDVPAEELEAMRERLIAAGIRCTPVVNHDDSELGVSKDVHPGVFVRSVYFRDPDGISLELAAWTKAFDESDVRHAPASVATV